jgi:hypothetical protein
MSTLYSMLTLGVQLVGSVQAGSEEISLVEYLTLSFNSLFDLR